MTASLLCFFFSTMISWFLLLTRPFHEKWTGDHSTGIQKTHRYPALRVGGLPIFLGLIGVTVYLATFASTPTTTIYFYILIGGSLIFFFGLAEDITERVRPLWRLWASIFSGAIFVVTSGYQVTNIDFPIVGLLFDYYWVSFILTSIAIAGLVNAVNIIDGYNGLASGAVSIMFLGLGLLAYRVGDISLALVSISFILLILGFFIFNFPLGRIFLGDGGAYFLGFSLAAVTIMLFERNTDISPWTAVLVIAYPIVETLMSIIRRVRRNRYGATEADALHLHHLVHRSFARPLARRLGGKIDSNPIAGTLMLIFPTLTVVLAQVGLNHTLLSILFLILFVSFYLAAYYRVALLRQSLYKGTQK